MNIIEMTHAPHVAAFEGLDWISYRMMFEWRSDHERREARRLMLLERAANGSCNRFTAILGKQDRDVMGPFVAVRLRDGDRDEYVGFLWRPDEGFDWDCDLTVDWVANDYVECMSAVCAIRTAMARRGWRFAPGVVREMYESLSGLPDVAQKRMDEAA